MSHSELLALQFSLALPGALSGVRRHEVVVLGRQTSRLARCTSQQNLLVASRCQFSYKGRVSVASEAADGGGIFCIPQLVFSYDSCVPVASYAAGGKMEPVKVDKVINSEKGKDFVITGFKILFQKIPVENMKRWFCRNKNVYAV